MGTFQKNSFFLFKTNLYMRCKEENNKNTHITCRHNKSPQNYHIHTGFTL